MRQKYSIGQPARIIGRSPASSICGAVVRDGVTVYAEQALVRHCTRSWAWREFGRLGLWRRHEKTWRESGGYGSAVLGEDGTHGSEEKSSFLDRR